MELTLTCSSTDVYCSDLEVPVYDISHQQPLYHAELGSVEGKQRSFDVTRSMGNGDVLKHSEQPSRDKRDKRLIRETENVLDSDPVGRIQSVQQLQPKQEKCVKVGELLSRSNKSLNGSVDKQTEHSFKYKIAVSTKKKSKTLFKCTFCSKTFKYNRQLLTHHIQDHQDRLHFACARCKIKFASVANLSDHVLIHLDSRPFKCRECLTSFSNQSSLANHRCSSVSVVQAVVQQQRASDILGRLPICKLVLKKLDYKVKQDRLTRTDIKVHDKFSDNTYRNRSRTGKFSSRHSQSLTPSNVPAQLCAYDASDRGGVDQLCAYDASDRGGVEQLCAYDASDRGGVDRSVVTSVEVKVEPALCIPTDNDENDAELSLVRTALGDHEVKESDKHFDVVQLMMKSVPNNILDWSPVVEQSADTADVSDGPDDTINWSPAHQSADSGDDTTTWFQDSELSKNTNNKKCIKNSTNKTRSKERIRNRTSKTKDLLSSKHCDVEVGLVADETSLEEDSMKLKDVGRNEQLGRREGGEEEHPYVCAQCDRRFITSLSLRRHETVQHNGGERQYVCKHCCERFDTAKHLKVHKRVHTDKDGCKLSACTVCGKRLTDLALHYRRVHENVRQYKCDKCNRWFFSSTELKQHYIRIHTDVRPYLCPRCGDRFAVLTDMHHHMSSHHGVRRMFSCTLCDNQYTSHAQLNVHIRIHNDERTYACTQCDMKFVSSSHMNRHRRRVHEKHRYSCDECTRTFAYVGELISHKLVHAPTCSHACTQCDKTFKLKSYLRTHIRTWHSENRRALMCPVCGKTFTAKGSLVVHSQLHTGVRRFTCPVCDKKFTKSYDVKVHVRQVHTNDRPYPCSHCGRKFASKGNMKNHELIHAGKELYGCTQCDEKFVFHTSLTKHMEQNHGRGGGGGGEARVARST